MNTKIVVEAICWGISAAWVGKLIETARGMPQVPNLLRPEYNTTPVGSPRVVVIVPAKNEAANVKACLESLLEQDYAEVQIIAVDDRSTDETGAIMLELAEKNQERLEILQVKDLPSGWLGKTHAMTLAAGVAIAKYGPEYLLFTDADILFVPDALRRAVVEAVNTEAEHFVLLPTTLVRSYGEGMLLAYLQMMSLWIIRPWKVSDPEAKRDAIGVGAFNMMKTAAYVQLGGFEAAPMEILEDLDLGRRVKLAGMRQRVAIGPGMVSVHWATGALGIMTGMTKNVFALFRFRTVLLVVAAASLGVFCLGPVGMLAFRLTRLAGICGLVAVIGLYAFSGRTSRISWLYAGSFPFAAIAAVYSMFRSMAVTLIHGGVSWRGTFYPLNELRRIGKSNRL